MILRCQHSSLLSLFFTSYLLRDLCFNNSFFIFFLIFSPEVGLFFFTIDSAVSQFNPEPSEEIKCFLAHERNMAGSVNRFSSFSSL